jgi:hypothetical protein
MKTFRFDATRAHSACMRFREFLNRHPNFLERDVVRIMREDPDLCVLAAFATGIGIPDRYAFEFKVSDRFRADFVCGSPDFGRGHFCFIEFEGGSKKSVFKPQRNPQQLLRDWGTGAERGFSQISDWSWSMDDLARTISLSATLGFREPAFSFVVVCGRTLDLDDNHQSRLNWRASKTVVNSQRVRFWTYDDLLAQAERTLHLSTSPRPRD